MKTLLPFLLIALLLSNNNEAQDLTAGAKRYFSGFTSSSQINDMLLRSLPTAEECSLVFTGNSADEYFKWISDMKSKGMDKQTEQVSYADVAISSFTTEDIIADKKNYAGGMSEVKDRLKPHVTFYQAKYLKNKGDQSGMEYNYFVNINGNWIFFPKPWRAFPNESSNNKSGGERKLRYLSATNGGLIGYFSDGTIASCPRCDLIKSNVENLSSASVTGTYDPTKMSKTMDYHTESDWAMWDYKWIKQPQ